jgi:hypothetical protein
MFALYQAAIRRCIIPSGIDVLKIFHARKWIDLPPEQFLVKRFRPLRIIRGNLKPDDARCWFPLLCLTGFGL